MRKLIMWSGGLAALLLMSGCSLGKKLDQAYLKDAEEFARPSTTTISAIAASDTSETEAVPAPTAPATAKPRPGVQTAVTPSMKYTEALAIFRDAGAYFQFVNCHGNPGSLTVKRNTRLMLDNRDALVRKLVVGKKMYTLGPYGFAITNADAVGINTITCDGGGAARLTVQP